MAKRGSPAWAVLLSIVFVLAVLFVAALLAHALVTAPAVHFHRVGFWSGIVEDRWVLLLVRVGLVAVVGYILVSVVALISRGQWLSTVGPVKAGEAVRAVAQDAEELRAKLRSAEEALEHLRQQPARLSDALAVAVRDRDEVFRENAQLRRRIEEQGDG